MDSDVALLITHGLELKKLVESFTEEEKKCEDVKKVIRSALPFLTLLKPLTKS